MNSYDNYIKSREELNFFIEQIQKIEEGRSDPQFLSVYYKASIVLLVTKIEKFSIDSCHEFYENLVKKNCKSNQIPKALKNEYVNRTISTLDDKIKNNNLSENDVNLLKTIELLWNVNFEISNISFEPTFETNNHGSKALTKVFMQIGFDDIFAKIDDLYISLESSVLPSTEVIDVKDKLNHLINIRNKIVHNDLNPNTTFKDLKLFVDVSDYFANKVNENIERRLTQI